MTPRAFATSLTTLVLLATAVLTGTSAGASEATTTAFGYRPAEGSTTQTGSWSVTDPDLVVVEQNGSSVQMGADVENMVRVHLILPNGAAPAPGLTFPLGTLTSSTVGTATAFMDRNCTYTSGTVTIHEWVGGGTDVTAAAIDVSGSCGDSQVRLGSNRPWSGLDVARRVAFGDTPLMSLATEDVVVAVDGASPVTFSDAEVVLPEAAVDEDFGIMDDGCAGTTVTPGGSCVVTVGFMPWVEGLSTATLVIPDATTIGSTRVALDGTGVSDSTGSYAGPTKPVRLVDTRKAGTRKPLAGGSTTTFAVAGAGVPAGRVSAVVLNLTAVATTSAGYFTMFPGGTSRPTASSINFPRGWTGANMVTVPVGADGTIALYNYGGPAHAVIDVLGWYWKGAEEQLGSQMLPLGDAFRVYDSRDDDDPFTGSESQDVFNDWGDPEANAQVVEYVLTVTAVGATKPGVLTVWSGEGTRPTASTVNYEPGVIAPNMVVVRAGHSSEGAGFRVSNTSSGSVHVVVDVVGIQLKDSAFGLRFTPRATPTRILDTRKGLGLTGAFTARAQRTVNASSVATQGESVYLVANTTGVQPTRRTYLSVWAPEPGAVQPDASILNVNAGAVRAASTYAPLTETSRFRLSNDAGSMHVVMDVAGTLDWYPSLEALGPVPGFAGRSLAASGADGSGSWPTDRGARTARLEDVSTRRVRG
ncbi:hypothetical protein [Oryzobacter terrae]|uniref:hypothetical protein n=1 Tax=Oryzobacter terrae TaxID=1620385 RepID=UPI0036727397